MLDRTGKIQTRNKGTAFIYKHDAVMGRIQLQFPVNTRQYPARLITTHCHAALSAVGFVCLQHFNQRCFSGSAVPSQNRNVPFQFDRENDPSASDFDFMFTLHPIASHKLKCNRHQFFHAVHHITGVQDFHIHREFFLAEIHEMPQVDGQVLLFRQLQNERCAVVTTS